MRMLGSACSQMSAGAVKSSFRTGTRFMTWQERNKEILIRLADDLRLRNLSAATVELYTYHVRRFGEFIGHSLDDATPEQIRSFQLHLINVRKASWMPSTRRFVG